MNTITLDFSGIKSYWGLHEYLKEVFQLPDYYGHNMDALWDGAFWRVKLYTRLDVISRTGTRSTGSRWRYRCCLPAGQCILHRIVGQDFLESADHSRAREPGTSPVEKRGLPF